MLLLNDKRNVIGIDTVLWANLYTASASDAGVGDKVALRFLLRAAEGEGSAFNRLFRQIEPLAVSFVQLENGQRAARFFVRIDVTHIRILFKKTRKIACTDLLHLAAH